MTELTDSEIRVRHRIGAVAVVYFVRLLAALLIALPIAGALGATGIAQFADGDAVLFIPGAMHLVEALRVGAPALIAATRSAAALSLLALALALLPLAGLLVALCHAGRLRLREWAGRAIEHLPAFVLLSGVSLLAQGGALFVTITLATAFRGALLARLSERGADIVIVAFVTLGVLFVAGIGIAHDLARAAAVRQRVSGRRALVAGLRIARSHARQALIGWALPSALAVAIVGVSALLVERLHIETPGELRLLAVAAIHQCAAFAIVALRAVWLATALRLVGPRLTRGCE